MRKNEYGVMQPTVVEYDWSFDNDFTTDVDGEWWDQVKDRFHAYGSSGEGDYYRNHFIILK